MADNRQNHKAIHSAQSEPGRDRMGRQRWIEVGLLLFFWGTIALLMLGQELLDPYHGIKGLLPGESLHAVLQIAVWALFTPFIFWVAARISPEKIGWLRTIPIAVVLGVMVAVIVDLIDHLLWNTLVDQGPRRPMSVLFVLDNFHFLNEFFVFVAVTVAGFARSFFLRVQEHRKEAIQLRMDTARLQTNLAEARLRALRMQINPHFLFNTLHIISDHFEENPRAARRMIARLSEILRYTFEGTENSEVTLEKELHFLDGYLDIQRFRFEDRLRVNKDIATDLSDALIPTLILQPLVENAIKHGVSQVEYQGIIDIKVWREKEYLHLAVSDNGPGKKPISDQQSRSGGIGLQNTRERLEMLYGNNHQFLIASPTNGGFTATIVLPYHTQNDYFLSAVDE